MFDGVLQEAKNKKKTLGLQMLQGPMNRSPNSVMFFEARFGFEERS